MTKVEGMQSKKFGNKYIIRIDKGEEVAETLKKFCNENKIMLGTISGIGAASKIVIGLFKGAEKEYVKKEFTGDFEIASLVGNITAMDNNVYLHLHIVISDKNLNSLAGHLNSAVVSGTCEVIIDSFDGSIGRKHSEKIGLNLLDFN